MDTSINHGGGLHAVPETLQEAICYFADPDTCHQFAVSIRWPMGVVCPRCGALESESFVKTRRIYNCLACKKQYSVKVGTIFEDSPLGLDKWFAALWMLVNCKNGVSSYEIHRSIGVTQKTAWFMLGRLRLALQEGTVEKAKFSGTVEADETFVGGKAKNMHKDVRERKITGRGASGKVVVAGVLQRGEVYIDEATGDEKKTASQVSVGVVPDTKAETLSHLVTARVEEGSELFTDAHAAYRALSDRYGHEFVDHAIRYVEGRVSTNGMENFWALVKRALKGTYVSVEGQHLFRYLDEQAFRFNERKIAGDTCKALKLGDSRRFVKALRGVTGKRLTYHELIGSPMGLLSPDPLRGGPRAD
jgi:transposase-like protein